MCYAWFLSGYNYFNVVIDEKSAFNNARDCFQLFFQRSVNIMETGIKDKVSVFCQNRTVFSVGVQTDIHILFRPVVALNLLFLGVIASMLCYIMWNTAVKQLGVVCATSYIYVVPLITLLTSAIVIDETITIVALLGSALILSGVYIAERGVNLKK